MTVIAISKVRGSRHSKSRDADRLERGMFYSGLVAFIALLVFGALSVIAVLPMIIPGYMAASVTSDSMTPTIRVGDVVIAADHGDAEIAPGTVVVYEDPRKQDLVTHRVVSTSPDGLFITRGDGTSVNDGAPIPEANIRSTAQWVVPYVGLPRVWAARNQWPLLVLTFAATAMALWLTQFAFDPRYDPWPGLAGSGLRPGHPSIAGSPLYIDAT